MNADTMISIAGFALMIAVQIAGAAYIIGRTSAILNGTKERVTALEQNCRDMLDAHEACSKNVNDRITGHIENYHTGGKR